MILSGFLHFWCKKAQARPVYYSKPVVGCVKALLVRGCAVEAELSERTSDQAAPHSSESPLKQKL